jgi:uroporphyrinogen-III synthase
VDVVAAYRTITPGNLAERARDLLGGAHKPDWITFTSSSTVQNLVGAIGVEPLTGIRIASIGPVTSATARKLGLQVTVEASRYDEDGLIEAILSKGIIEK